MRKAQMGRRARAEERSRGGRGERGRRMTHVAEIGRIELRVVLVTLGGPELDFGAADLDVGTR